MVRRPPVVERIADMPAGTIGFRVTGDVDADDYRRVLAPDLRQAVESADGVRAVYVIEDIDELEPAALWEDTKLGFDAGVRHHHAWKRSAIVTDIAWMARASQMFAWMIPGEARVFGLDRVDEAKAWVAGDGD
jgi:SpoIIAA-like